jgi:prophage regulatory protein
MTAEKLRFADTDRSGHIGICRLLPECPNGANVMARLEKTRVRRQGSIARPDVDRHCTSDSSSCPSAPALSDDQSIESTAVTATDRPLTSEDAGFSAKDDEFWGFKTVIAKTGLSRSSVYGYVARGIFPRQRRLGPRRVAWLASEVRAWICSRPL